MPDSNNNNNRPEFFGLRLTRKILAWRLFARRKDDSGNFDIIKWWELRRIPYNLIVGATGMLTLIAIFAVAAIGELVFGVACEWPDPPIFAIFAVVAYGIAANVCYTGGWVVEILVRKVWKERAGAFGEIAFFLGLIFSVLLTLAPAALFTGLLVLRLILR